MNSNKNRYFLLFKDHFTRTLTRAEFPLVLRICIPLHLYLCQLFWFTLKLLGHAPSYDDTSVLLDLCTYRRNCTFAEVSLLNGKKIDLAFNKNLFQIHNTSIFKHILAE